MKHYFTKKRLTFRRLSTAILTLATATVVHAYSYTITVTVQDKRFQTVTGFGAACCDGAMQPYGDDTTPVRLLYGPTSKIGLNIMRMEISPNFKGDITAADVGWDTPYDWKGSLPSAKIVKQRGGIVETDLMILIVIIIVGIRQSIGIIIKLYLCIGIKR